MEKFFDKKIAAAQINRNSFISIAEQLLILMVVMILLSLVALFLFIGACMYDRIYIMPWIWTKYCIIFVQIMRFIMLIVQLSTSAKNPAGPSPIFELVLLGKGLFFTVHSKFPMSHFLLGIQAITFFHSALCWNLSKNLSRTPSRDFSTYECDVTKRQTMMESSCVGVAKKNDVGCLGIRS